MVDFVRVQGSERTHGEKGQFVGPALVREILIADLIRIDGVSVRLKNCVSFAEAGSRLPFRTVGDYLDAGPAAQPTMLRQVPNFGRKTARELQALIEVACANGMPLSGTAAQEDEPDAEDERSRLLKLFEKLDGHAVVDGELVSARLLNVLRLTDIADRPLIEILGNLPALSWEMLRLQNCGRKSVNEFRLLCERFVGRTLVQRGYTESEVARAVALISGRPLPSVSEDPERESQDFVSDQCQPSGFVIPEHETPAERLEWLMTELGDRSGGVLRRRYGIGHEASTLEEVGVVYGVTRERIRQIEKKSLKKLRVRTRQAPLDQLMAAEAPHAWKAVSENGYYLRERRLHEARRRLSPYIALALDVLEIRLDDWLDNIAVRLPHGWCSKDEEPAQLEEVADAITKAIDGRPLPLAIAQLGLAASEAQVHAACELILGRGVRDGYLVPPRVGARLARALGLHGLLSEQAHPVPVVDLLATYHRCFPHDLCSARDAEIVMEAAPHLFLEVEEDSWIAVGAGSYRPEQIVESVPRRFSVEEPGTIAHALQEALSRLGPTRIGDLLEMAGEILPPDRSVNSIGPVLLTRRDLFIRALPGVYALPEHLPSNGVLTTRMLAMLLNEQQARLFALARYAGEPIDLFPYWSPASEFELCRWARHSADRATFCSLLAVADIDQWPLSSGEREEWQVCRGRDGRFELGAALRRHAAYRRPELERLLAALVHSLTSGSLNWMAANRLTGRNLDSHGGVALLVALLRLGALEEPSENGFQWQMAHAVAPAAAELRDRLLRQLALTGELEWESELGRSLSRQALATEKPSAWVDPVSAAAIFEGDAALASDEADEGDPVELLMAAHRRSKEAERRQATLQWLLAE